MNELTKDYSKLDHITTTEVEDDLNLTIQEAEQYQAELDVLEKNPVENRTDIYFKQGHLLNRNDLIVHLQNLLEYRKGLG